MGPPKTLGQALFLIVIITVLAGVLSLFGGFGLIFAGACGLFSIFGISGDTLSVESAESNSRHARRRTKDSGRPWIWTPVVMVYSGALIVLGFAWVG